MLFNTIEFFVFYIIVLTVYFIIPKKLRCVWLLVSSYFFYMQWNAKYASLIAFSTLITYICALGLERIGDNPGKDKTIERRKKLIVAFCIIINLLILAFFKYCNFLIDTINGFAAVLRMRAISGRLNLLLPVGISFYTFQALGYIIDVYRGEIKAERNIVRYALFVSFFPQLVAGPIERSKNLMGQFRNIESIKLFDIRRIASGTILVVWGLFLKMVIADRAAILVDNVYDDYRMYGGTELIIAAILFSIQIYCDFASYSIIAIGTARILGFELMENFNAPYLARDIRDFWDRWHISLSTWFRDYLYIPLGGNRKGKLRKNLNLLIVFLVSGLWHGAGWNFVAWGFMHGLFRVIGETTISIRKKLIDKFEVNTECFSYRLLRVICTFVMTTFAWIFFRSSGIKDALRYIKRIIFKPTPWLLTDGRIYELGLDRIEFNILIFALVILVVVDLLRLKKNIKFDDFLLSQNLWFECVVVIGLIVLTLTFGIYGPGVDAKQFIYFQF